MPAHEPEGKPVMIQSYSDTSYGGIIAGHMFRLPLSKLGMFPLPRACPFPTRSSSSTKTGNSPQTASGPHHRPVHALVAR